MPFFPLRFLRLLSVPGLVVLAALATGCRRQAAPTGMPALPPPEVAVATLRPQRVELTRELPGRAAAFVIAEVRPQVGGIVERRLFTEGGNVTAGQVLYEIDDAAYAAEHASAKAALARAEAALELARVNARRAAGLTELNAVSRQENDNAVAALRQAEAEVSVAQAAVERTGVTLSRCRVISPIAGRIGRSAVTQGALVTANQADALAVVQQLDPIYVDVTQSSREWLELRRELAAGTVEQAELPVTILLENGTRYAHQGKLAFSEVAVDRSTGSIAVRVVVPNPEELLLPGMYVRAVIGTAVRDAAILVPQPGVARDPSGGTSALVVGAEGKVEAKAVRVSRTIGDQWLVEEGLAAGDRVIVQGVQKVRPGMAVTVVEATRPAGSNPSRK